MAQTDDKLTVDQLAEKIKAKYPQYKDLDNQELVDKIIAQFPDYAKLLDVKKKDQSEEEDLVVEDGTSDGETGGLDSLQTDTETEVAPYLVDNVPVEREEIIKLLNNPDFNLDNHSIIISNDEEVQALLENRRNQEKSEGLSVEESANVITEEINQVDTTKQSNIDNLVNIRETYKENPKVNFNPTLTYPNLDASAIPAVDSLLNMWEGSPLNIESAYRDEELNNEVNGNESSYHLHGLAIDLTGDSAKEVLEWINTTDEGRQWAEKYTEGAAGGLGIEFEFEGTPKEHLHIQFKRGVAKEIHDEEHNDNPTHFNEENPVPGKITSSVEKKEIGNGYNAGSRRIEDVSNLYNEDEYEELASLGEPSASVVGGIRKTGTELYTKEEIEELQNLREYDSVNRMYLHNNKVEKFLTEEKSLTSREEDVVNNYLNNGWSHKGNGVYVHNESGLTLTPEMTGGVNPLLADNSIYPIIIERISENPEYFKDMNSDKINSIYQEFNPIDYGFNEQMISKTKKDDKRELKTTEQALKRAEFIQSIVTRLARTENDKLEDKGLIEEAKRLAIVRTNAETWLEKQTSLINSYPKNLYGEPDVARMSEKDIEDYNSLIENYNTFYNNQYQTYLKEHDDFMEIPAVKKQNILTESYNDISKYQASLNPDGGEYSIYQKMMERKQEETDKWYASSDLGSVLSFTGGLFSDVSSSVGKTILNIPKQIKGLFSYENNYDWTDKVAQYAVDYAEGKLKGDIQQPSFLRPTATKSDALGKISFVEVEDKTIILSPEGGIVRVLNDDKTVVSPTSEKYKEITEEYIKNTESYPTQSKRNITPVLYNLADGAIKFGLDMAAGYLTMGMSKAYGLGKVGQAMAFRTGLSGSTNLRMYYGAYEEALNQGMSPSEANNYATYAAGIQSAIEFATPDLRFLSPRLLKQTTDKVGANLLNKTTKSDVNKLVWNRTLRNSGTYGVIEGLEEVAQGGAVQELKNNYYQEYNFKTTRSIDEKVEEFLLGALIGGTYSGVSTKINGRKLAENDLYNEAVITAYNENNRSKVFDAIKKAAKNNSVADEVITKLKNNFKTLDDMEGSQNLSDLAKKNMLTLIESKRIEEANQGSRNQVEANNAKSNIKAIDKAMNNIMMGADPVSEMYKLSNDMDTEITNYVGNFVKNSDVDPGIKSLIRRFVRGDSMTDTEQEEAIQAMDEMMTKLENQESMSSKDKTNRDLLKQLTKDYKTIKTVKDDRKTTTTKSKGEVRGPSRRSKGKGIGKDIEQASKEEDNSTLNQNIGKKVNYKGKDGILRKNKNGEFILETPGRGRGIKIKNATPGKRLKTVGLTYTGRTVSTTPDGKLTVDGKTSNIVGLSKNQDGSLDGVITLDNDVSEDIQNKAKNEFQKLKNKRNKNTITQEEFLSGVENIKGLKIERSNDVKFKAAASTIINDILNAGDLSVISMSDVNKMIEEAKDELQFEQDNNTEQEQVEESKTKKREKKKKTKNKKRSPKPLASTEQEIDSLIEEYSKYESDYYRNAVEVLKAAKKLFLGAGQDVLIFKDAKSIFDFSISNGVSIEESMSLATGGRGLNLETGIENNATMIINLDLAKSNTVFHEAAHPFVTSIFQLAKNNKNAKKIVESIEKILPKKYLDFGYSKEYVKDKDGKVPFDKKGNIDRSKVTNKYDTNGPLAEALAEYLADAGKGKFKSDESNLKKAINYATSTLSSLFKVETDKPLDITIKELSELTKIEDVVNVFTSVLNKGRSFEQYQDSDVVETKDAKKYADSLKESVSKRKEDRFQVDVLTEKQAQEILDNGGKLFLTKDGMAGGYVKADGYMGGLFRNPESSKKRASKALQDVRIKSGGKYFDAYATYLEDIYIKNGFRPVARIPFNEEYAPEGWQESNLSSKPDVVFFVYDPSYSSQKGEGEVVDTYEQGEKIAQDYTPDASPEITYTILPKFQVAEPSGTKGFKNWFGNGMLKDSNNKPIPFYHGTSKKDFKKFRQGVNESIFFSPDPEFANNYAAMDPDMSWVPDFENYLPGSRVIPVYLNPEKVWDYENPAHRKLIIPLLEKMRKAGINIGGKEINPDLALSLGSWAHIERFSNDIRKMGFDAYYVGELADIDPAAPDSDKFEYTKNLVDNSVSRQIFSKNIGVFEPQQVRSVNRKDFSNVKSPKYQKTGSNFTTLESAIDFTEINSATPNQWIEEMIRVGGMNIDNEMNFIGMKDFLKSVERAYPDGLIPKVAISDYITMNSTSVEMNGSTMNISNPMFNLGSLNVQNKFDDNGEMSLVIDDINVPDLELMSNINPIIRTLISFATESDYDSVVFPDGSKFTGPKVEFINEIIPEVISDVVASIDSKSGPVLTSINNEGLVSLDITNKSVELTEDSNGKMSQEGEFDSSAKTVFSTDPKFQKTGDAIYSFIRDFNFYREFKPGGNIPSELVNMSIEKEGKIKSEKFKLIKLTDRLRDAIESNKKEFGNDAISLKDINDALTDPTQKIRQLESEVAGLEYDLEVLELEGKTYAVSEVINKINETEESIKIIKQNKAGRATVKDLESSPEIQKIVKEVRRTIDGISNKLMDVVGDGLAGKIDNNLGLYVNKQYRIHHDDSYKKKMIQTVDAMITAEMGKKSNQDVLEKLIKEVEIINSLEVYLKERLDSYLGRESTPIELLTEIKEMIEGNPEKNPFISNLLGADRIDTKIFKARVDLPTAISNLYGEIENPLFNITNTISKINETFQKLEFKKKVIESLEGTLVFKKENRPAYLTDRRGKLYNPFSETIRVLGSDIVYYTNKEVKEFIEGEMVSENFISIQKLNSVVKLGKTVYNPITHVRNFLGNIHFASINGHAPKNFLESWKVMQNLFNKSTTQERENMFSTMIENGIIDSVNADEIKGILKDGYLGIAADEFYDNDFNLDNIKKKNPNALQFLNNYVNKAYLFEDVVWKGAGFMSEVQLYLNAGFGRDEAVKKAAEHIRDGYATYSLVPKVAKRLRRAILVGDFISFQAEVVRTSINSFYIAKEQFMSGNPVLRRASYRRMSGIAFSAFGIKTLNTLLLSGIATGASIIANALRDMDDDGEDDEIFENDLMSRKLMNNEEVLVGGHRFYPNLYDYYDKKRGQQYDQYEGVSREKMIQLFSPSWMKYADVKLISAQTDDDGLFDGTMYVWNATENLTDNLYRKMFSAIFNTPEDDPTFRPGNTPGWLDDLIFATFEPFISKSMLTDFLIEAGTGKEESGKPIHKPNDTDGKKVLNILNKAYKDFRPAFLNVGKKLSDASGLTSSINEQLNSWYPNSFPYDKDSDRSSDRSFAHETISLSGFRLGRFNIQENFYYKTMSVLQDIKQMSVEGKDEDKLREYTKKRMVFLDKLHMYSEALGIEADGVEGSNFMVDKIGVENPDYDSNRDLILSKFINNYSTKHPVWQFLNRNRIQTPDWDTYLENNEDTWMEFLTNRNENILQEKLEKVK